MVNVPNDTQHIAIAGMTGSGKTVGALAMLADKDFDRMAWIILDHKRDDNIAQLPAEHLNPNSMILPNKGLWVVKTKAFDEGSAEEIEGLMKRAFNRGGIGFYVDEGHLMPKGSAAVRTIMVAGRSKRVPMMWTSQRAHWIDSFIWAQSSFFRAFMLQNPIDHKKFNEFFPRKYFPPQQFHSHYFDVAANTQSYLVPAPPIEMTIDKLREKLVRNLRAI